MPPRAWRRLRRGASPRPGCGSTGLRSSLLSPVFFFRRGQAERDRVLLDHLELGAAVRAGDDLPLLDVALERHRGFAFRAGRGRRGRHWYHLRNTAIVLHRRHILPYPCPLTGEG